MHCLLGTELHWFSLVMNACFPFSPNYVLTFFSLFLVEPYYKEDIILSAPRLTLAIDRLELFIPHLFSLKKKGQISICL